MVNPYPDRWGNEFLVNTTNSFIQIQSSTTKLADGRFVVVWADASKTLSAAFADGYDVRGQIFNADGTKSGAEFIVNTVTTKDQLKPDVAALANGGFTVVWEDRSLIGGDNSVSSIKSQVYSAAGTKVAGEVLVNTLTAGAEEDPAITTLSDGRMVVVWTDSSHGAGDTAFLAVRGQILTAAGAKSGGEFLVNTLTALSQFEPDVVALAGGKFAVAWTSNFDPLASEQIFLQIYNADGTRSGTQIQVTNVDLEIKANPSLTLLTNGNFVVTYTGVDDILAQIFTPSGVRVGGEIAVKAIDAEGDVSIHPVVAALRDGKFVVAWDENDSTPGGGDLTSSSIHAQVVGANGALYGPAFLVNTTAINTEEEPSITVLADGRFMVTWTQLNFASPESVRHEIRAQIFDPREAGVTLAGTGLNDQFVGTDFADQMSGGTGIDTLDARGGNDRLDGGTGADKLLGGLGNDTYVLGNDKTDIITDSGGNDTVQSTIDRSLLAGELLNKGIENITLIGGGVINATGNGVANVLIGGSGNNMLTGGAGADTLDPGTAGIDQLIGGDGNDTYVLGARASAGITITEAATPLPTSPSGIDTVTSTATRSLATFANVENLTLIGSAAINGTGNSLANTITGNAAANILNGGVEAVAKIDTLKGGDGNDAYVLGTGADLVVELANQGIDTITSTISRTLAANVEKLTLLGTSNINGTGNALANTITGNSGNNILNGGVNAGPATVDILIGGAGNDTYVVHNAFEQIIDSSGTDTVFSDFGVSLSLLTAIENAMLTGSGDISGYGTNEANVLTGNEGLNTLLGYGGDDTLIGNGGVDWLNGGLGNDSLDGGTGADTFFFGTALDAVTNFDKIKGFVAGSDRVFLLQDVFSSIGLGVLAEENFFRGKEADKTDDFIIYDPDKGVLYYDADGSGPTGQIAFAYIGTGLALTSSDFTVLGGA